MTGFARVMEMEADDREERAGERQRLAEAITAAAWETFGGDQNPADLWHAWSDRLTEILSNSKLLR